MRAEVAEQVDALRSGRSGLYARKGSTPFLGTNARSGFWLKSQSPLFGFRSDRVLPHLPKRAKCATIKRENGVLHAN